MIDTKVTTEWLEDAEHSMARVHVRGVRRFRIGVRLTEVPLTWDDLLMIATRLRAARHETPRLGKRNREDLYKVIDEVVAQLDGAIEKATLQTNNYDIAESVLEPAYFPRDVVLNGLDIVVRESIVEYARKVVKRAAGDVLEKLRRALRAMSESKSK